MIKKNEIVGRQEGGQKYKREMIQEERDIYESFYYFLYTIYPSLSF